MMILRPHLGTQMPSRPTSIFSPHASSRSTQPCRSIPGLIADFVYPVCFRRSDEMRGPLDREADLSQAFEIVEATNERLPMPTEQALAKTGDVAAYAKAYTGFVRAFADSTLRTGLFDGSTSSAADAGTLADDFFRRLHDLFAAEPNRHGFEHRVATLVLRRR